jgi:hypothetical protein
MTIATPMTNGLSDQAVDDVLAQADEASAPPRPAMRAAGAAQKPEIPEYLRSKPSGKRVLIIAVVAVVVVGWGIFVINNNPFQNGSRTADDKQPGENRAVEVVANDVAGDSDRQPQDDAALPDQAEPDGDQVSANNRLPSQDRRSRATQTLLAMRGRDRLPSPSTNPNPRRRLRQSLCPRNTFRPPMRWRCTLSPAKSAGSGFLHRLGRWCTLAISWPCPIRFNALSRLMEARGW